MIRKPKSNVNYLELSDFEDIVEKLRSIREEFTEDIPPFETRILEYSKALLVK
jgi:hypothetical protein